MIFESGASPGTTAANFPAGDTERMPEVLRKLAVLPAASERRDRRDGEFVGIGNSNNCLSHVKMS
jgi:hypothetical protein